MTMTQAEKELYLLKWNRFQQRYERIYTTKLRAALKEQIQQQISLGYITSAPIYDVLISLYRTVGPLWAHATDVNIRRQQAKAQQPMGFSERIVELMRQYYGVDLFNDAETITEYTRTVMQRVFSEAAVTGWSIDEIVRRLEADTELGAMRARRIARTETVAAANAASIINATETGVPMRKIWLAVNDKRTRHSHRNVDEVTIPIADAFNVGGTQMTQPGVRTQPNGLEVPAGEVVNCRCTLGYEVIKQPR